MFCYIPYYIAYFYIIFYIIFFLDNIYYTLSRDTSINSKVHPSLNKMIWYTEEAEINH